MFSLVADFKTTDKDSYLFVILLVHFGKTIKKTKKLFFFACGYCCSLFGDISYNEKATLSENTDRPWLKPNFKVTFFPKNMQD